MMQEVETIIQDELGDDELEFPLNYSITSYGADYDVDGLVRRIQRDDIHVPSFQRGYVWTIKQASKFIESLLLGLPVPGIFLSKEQPTQKLLVVDGQQRLRSLQYFYEGTFVDNKEFKLKGVHRDLENQTYQSLNAEARRRLDNSILHATIFRQDEPSDDQSSVYQIFERLNTGGTQLQPQEIRACIYDGPFNDLLRELNHYPAWRSVYGPINSRMRDQELILRFLAFYFRDDKYKSPLKSFLNKYMADNRYLKVNSENQVAAVFQNTIDTVLKCLGNRAFRPERALNAAVFDAVMVGIARRLEECGPVAEGEALQSQYQALLDHGAFINATKKSTSDERNVSLRINLATETFAEVS